MPPGIPVATMAIGKPGARNAAIFAVQIMAIAEPELRHKLETYKQEMAHQVEQKAAKIEKMVWFNLLKWDTDERR